MHPKQNERAIRKIKALMSKRKHEQSFCYAPSRECGCILSIQFFSGNSSRGWRRRKYAGIIHIPGCICHFALGFCKNIKKRTETLYQSFSPFMEVPSGFEPENKGFADLRLTTWLWHRVWSGRRDSNSRHPPWQGGTLPLSYYRTLGALGRNRTTDTQIFSLLLYRLSYQGMMATRKGLEPSTSSVTGWHSNQLNYRATSWWEQQGSNL